MVNRIAIGVWLCCVLLGTWAQAQDLATLGVSVQKTEVNVFDPFMITVEFSGTDLVEIKFPTGDGLQIDQNPRSSHKNFTITGNQRTLHLKYSFVAQATKPGKIIIPPFEGVFGGGSILSEPIELIAKDDNPAFKYPVHARVNRSTVKVGQWFWIFLEAPPLDRPLPNELPSVDGVEAKPAVAGKGRTNTYALRRARTQTRGYRVRAIKPGILRFPSLDFELNRHTVQSNPLDITVLDKPLTAVGLKPDTNGLPFVSVELDSREIYLGEAVLLTMQLWQPQDKRIGLSPRSGSTGSSPSTEGFYAIELPDDQFQTQIGATPYLVTEHIKKLLYPTKTGELTIGQWKYEADYTRMRDNPGYFTDYGPYTVKVKPLPPAPAGFNGAIGPFMVDVKLESTSLKAGVPIKLDLMLIGQGNADAIGAPDFPEIPWAHVSEPERITEEHILFGQVAPGVKKIFRYTITPTDAGKRTIKAFDYAVFNPDLGEYEEQRFGPYTVNVALGDDESGGMIVSKESVDKPQTSMPPGSDIHPPLAIAGSLSRSNDKTGLVYLFLLLPVIAYGVIAYRMKHRRRIETDKHYARSHNAKDKGAQRLQNVLRSDEPTDELYRAMLEYIGNVFNVTEQGMTSSDVQTLLEERRVESHLITTIVRLLKSCERASYASQELSENELRALVQAAETALHALSVGGKP